MSKCPCPIRVCWFDGKLNSVKIEITVQGISHKFSSFTKTLKKVNKGVAFNTESQLSLLNKDTVVLVRSRHLDQIQEK